ncbi:hypothetical protein TCAL_07160 [Tigriopus californicus]|uniref:non-specific serine/threonine protein kinase n=1 Tax=Tigriopus californicus TaxID=6832 RepID=A0A553NEC4_TIGCA|nr:serine/threonine-protein kinase Nek4-like [Tigriopus californicus]TRY63781.1 hypothetical protein TCAL_07160 [Tigriopus californicus]|eukprot:TCALIF_07160-PA protein Name:"Similar to Nek4 Serine/threonine-protein kinase Nek4 (Mus musculus)" AED:0.08 eAED:0.08 QI:116/1/1/1/1/1/5/171/330
MSQDFGSGSSSSGGIHERIGPSSKYERCRILGSGTFGEAWLVRSIQSNRQYVVKELKMTSDSSDKDRNAAFNEVHIIQRCSHVNIIRYKEFYTSLSASGVPLISIVMEYADGGDLGQLIKKHRLEKQFLEEGCVKNYLVQITFALHYLHKNNILHRDLKTQNIFLTSTKLIKVGDFGISKTLSHENDFASTGLGTPQYLSPEICCSKPYDYKSDMWALGCVLYEMCALAPAFPGQDLARMVVYITRASYKPIPNHYSINMAELVKVLLRPEPGRRPSAKQLLDSKVLQSDIQKYMAYINSLPEQFRKNSNGSVSSSDMPAFQMDHLETAV